MNAIQKFLAKFQSNNIQNKQPSFVVTNYNSNLMFQKVIDDYNNKDWFEQYILYVNKSIDFISDSMLDFQPFIVNENNEKIKNQLLKDLYHFNNYQTFNEARKIKEMHLRLTGAAAWVLQPSDNVDNKYDFFILDPTKLYLKTNEFGLPSYYDYEDGDGKIVRFEVEEIIHFKRPNHLNWFEGLSQIESMKYLINSYAAGSQMNMNRLLNNGMPDFLLWFNNLIPEERERIEQDLKMKYGGIKNNGKQGVMTSQAKPERIDLSNTNKDLEYIEGMKMLRQDILAMFGIPEGLVFPSSTNSNTKESLKVFQQTVLQPALRSEADVFNEQLIKKYFGNIRITQLIEFSYKNPVDQDRKEEAEILKVYVDAKIMTRNEAREQIGLEPIDGGDNIETNIPTNFNNQDNNNVHNNVDKFLNLETKLKGIEDILNKESIEAEEKRLKQKALNDAIETETELTPTLTDMFTSQAKRFINKYNNKKPTLRNLPKKETEDELIKEVLSTELTKVFSNVNAQANTEIKQKLYKKNARKFVEYKDKALTPENIEELDKYLDYFAVELNKTTLDQFKKLVSKGLTQGFNMTRFKKEIAALFNGYIDGVSNKEILNKYEVYEDAITISNDDNVVLKSGKRYNAMLENIKKLEKDITKKEYNKLLKALKGTIDMGDPIGNQVNTLLVNIYDIPDGSKGITENRITTIARTTSTFVRNLSFDSTYDNNPFIIGKTWISAQDSDTREAHSSADGQTVKTDDKFIVGGEKLKYPGDRNGSPENIINCRCRIIAEV